MYRTGKNHPRITCSFCGKGPEQVAKILTGPGVHICNECVQMCYKIMVEELAKDSKANETAGTSVVPQQPDLPTPAQIKAHLDEYVVGQDSAKVALSVSVYNHYKRLRQPKEVGTVEVEKSNLLLIGPTGSGKTLLAQTMARFLNVPFTIVDATVLTEAGYVGEDVESILVRLLQAADYNVQRAEQGIIFVDEMDKIARKTANPSITRDVSGEGVQQGLLKILEGTVAAVPPKGGRKHPEQNLVHINTRNILFICGGAFETLDRVVMRRINRGGMGFGADIHSGREIAMGELFRQCEPDDLIQFGLIPELVGRLPVVVGLDELDEAALLNILNRPRNALTKQYARLFEMEGITLKFTDDALQAIVRQTLDRKTGARGLRSVMERVLQKPMYDLPGQKDIQEFVVTAEMVDQAMLPEPAPLTLRSKVA
ncbi:MAG TPA: ATP-dependent Clp protease ATP-binding subunit ClpX [Fibrobacteraceae bacterium]|nr:ATP-dependent Clp protease ATP-binding subunit ClpX [Fibrobacteraceae bacterium]